MPLKTNSNDLRSAVSEFNFSNNGDWYELKFGHDIIRTFPSIERFWQQYITPITKRIDKSADGADIHQRDNIAADIRDLASTHYTIFLNLVYAKESLRVKQLSYFENFYTHLGSAIDLTESFLEKVFFISLYCKGDRPRILTKLSEGKFLSIAKKWFEEQYPTTYEHYYSKGKHYPIKLIDKIDLLEEFYQKASIYKDFRKTSQSLREYRNIVVHNTQIASRFIGGKKYVPKRSKIQNYKKWTDVFDATAEQEKNDFIFLDDQMDEDFIELTQKLEALWAKPIRIFDDLLYNTPHETILRKYDLEYTIAAPI